MTMRIYVIISVVKTNQSPELIELNFSSLIIVHILRDIVTAKLPDYQTRRHLLKLSIFKFRFYRFYNDIFQMYYLIKILLQSRVIKKIRRSFVRALCWPDICFYLVIKKRQFFKILKFGVSKTCHQTKIWWHRFYQQV